MTCSRKRGELTKGWRAETHRRVGRQHASEQDKSGFDSVVLGIENSGDLRLTVCWRKLTSGNRIQPPAGMQGQDTESTWKNQ